MILGGMGWEGGVRVVVGRVGRGWRVSIVR